MNVKGRSRIPLAGLDGNAGCNCPGNREVRFNEYKEKVREKEGVRDDTSENGKGI